MIKELKRSVSMVLCAAMLITSVPVSSEAHWDNSENTKPEHISTGKDGTVNVEDSWEDTYPYGAFLFENSEASVTEGSDEITIPLYRLGGTSGRATAYIAYAPAVALMGDGNPAYGLAAGSEDVAIRVENPLPVARYQEVGKDADPEPSDIEIEESEYVSDDAEPGDRLLTIDSEGESFQWYILYEGRWRIVEGAEKKEFVVARDMLEDTDYRCVFEKDGQKFCSKSYTGETYVKPEQEQLEEMPKDIDLKPDQTFTDLDLSSENPYGPAMFSVTFADGEWMKEIRVSTPDNEKANPLRIGTFTILDNYGGAIFEKASTVTLSVMDNDKEDPYTLGFLEDKVSADKATGGAVVHLKRKGGGQNTITLDWKTVDGTAVAGEDYESKTGTAFFYADVDEVTIEIPLIDDGVKTDEEKTFSIELGELKGDAPGLCTVTDESIEVSLTNSGEGRSKFGNFLTISPDEEKSIDDDEPVTGSQVITPDEDLLHGEIAGYNGEAAPAGENGSVENGLDPAGTFNYGEISFAGGHGGNYWSDRAYVAGQSQNDITGWSGGSSDGNGWKIESNGYSNATLKIPNMNTMYSDFDGHFEYNAKLARSWTLTWYGYCIVYGGAEIPGRSFTSCNPQNQSTTWTYKVSYTTNGNLSDSWGMTDNVNELKLWTTKNKDHEIGDNNAFSRITKGSLKRRVFNNNLNLRIHTANDGESGGGDVITAPANGAALKKDSGVYASMKPEVVIDNGNGGVNDNGRIYVGSKLKFSLKYTDSYKPYSGSALNTAVYMTRSDGSIVNARIEPGTNGVYYVTMLWDGMKEADLNDTYTINAVMTRSQEIELNLRPSVPRKTDDKGNITSEIDTDKVGEAWNDFWRSGSDYITLGVSEAMKDAPHFGSKNITEIKIPKTDWASGDKNPLKNLGTYENVQYINFNRSKNDVIAVNGNQYNGNDKIYLSVSDLAFAKVSFSYYKKEYLSMPSIMEASISRVELYLDGNGDGKINGSYNANTGYFVLDEGTEDTFEFYMEEGGSYDESMFQPVELEGGKYGQYFTKIFYTMTPRCLEKPIDAKDSDVAQVLPAFTTSRTEEEMISRLTEEQNSYRYIMPGTDKDGKRTSDGHVMYGAEATAMQYVDVPLGGDHSPIKDLSTPPDENTDYSQTEYHNTYEWNPDYEGNLIYPFSNPEPILLEHTLMGDNFPIVDYDYDSAKGVTTDAEAKEKLNGYLGSFTGDTTIALCVTEQEHTADELQANAGTAAELEPESSSLTERSASPNGDWASETNDGDMGAAGMDTSDGDQHDYSEFDIDYNANLASWKGSLPQGLATIVTGKNKISILISVPILSKTVGKDKKTFPKTITDPLSLSTGELAGVYDKLKNGSYDKLLEQWDKAGYKDSKSGKSIECMKTTFSLSFAMTFNIKYDTNTNNWYFQEFAAGITGAVSFKYTVRLAACPFIYAYISINAKLTVGSGGTISHNVVEGKTPLVPEGQDHDLNKNEALVVSTDYVNLNIRFKGKVYIEVLDSKDGTTTTAGTRTGYINSDGGNKIQVQLKNKSDGLKFDSTKYVRIVGLTDSTRIYYMNTVEDVTSKLLWSGVSINPTVNLEIGVGAGVELAKLEAFIKINVSANFILGKQMDDGSLKGAMVDSASFSLGVAIRATFLMFTFEMDAVAIKGSYTYSTDKWKWAYTVFGKDHPISAAGTGGEGGDSLLQLPHDVSKTQTIYSSQTGTAQGSEGGLSAVQAYDPGDSNVPFQLSGYNSQCDALLLADGLDLSYDYRVVTVNNENYVVYMMGRPRGTGMDTSMLAVSRLVTTDEGDGQVTENSNAGEGENEDGLGLVNPLDWETVEVTDSETGVTYEYKAVKAPEDRSETPYILVDLAEVSGALEDDGTGDLEFDVSVSGSTINVAWVSYAKKNAAPSSDARKAFQTAAKNTVVKQASYDTSQKEGFSKAVTLNTAGHAVYNPTIIDDTHTAFVKANHVTSAQRINLLSAYEKKLNSFGYYKDSENDSNKNIYDFRMENYENIIDYKGGSSDLCIYSFKTKKLTEFSNMGGSTSGYASSEKTPVIDKLEGIPAADDSSAFYVAYTVWDEDLTNEDKQKDGQHNSALYIADLKQGTSVVTSRYGQHKLVSDHLKGTDGAGEHKMIDTLDFFRKNNYQDVNNVLDDNVLIVGQGENLYTMEYGDLETCLVGKGSMETEPLKATSFYGGEIEENSRSEFTFGEDADGNLVTVYVGSMKDTTNTALFLSTYDGKNKEWGKGVILAMRHMDVYEDAAKNGWTHEETEKAYLGNRTGYDRGGMDQFQFGNPQIALGVKTAEEGGTAEGEATTTGFDRFGTSLVILTGGMMRYLTTETGPDGEKVVTPGTAPENAVPKEGKGIYAVCYGVGHHSIGHGNITFTSENFSAGSELSAGISFINTGDVSIRGSEDNPITVTLNAVGDKLISKTLATWSVTENIRSGQEVQLHGIFTLPVTLPKGAEFSIAVSEDASYAEDPFSATLKGLYAIDEKAELGFEDCSIDLSRQDNGKLTLDDKGNAVLDVDLYVGNRGIKDVDDAYLQFSYGIYDPMLASKVEASEGGESSWSDTIFNALDITDHSLTVGDEEELPALTAVGGTENNGKEGILSLGRIRAGYGRHVRGTITVSAEEFAYFDETAINDPAGSLKIAVEIYDSSDEVEKDDFNIHHAKRNEYDEINNRSETVIEHTTSFVLPTKLEIPAGLLLRLPLNYSSTLGSTEPDVTVAELTDCELENSTDPEDDSSHMDQTADIVSYDPGSYSKGYGYGTVIIRGAKEGNSYIRIQDMRTNSFKDISVIFTAPGGGLDIEGVSGLFQFFDENGKTAKSNGKSWQFQTDVKAWGAAQSEPYRKTLANGKPGMSFSFETEAESINLYFDGEVNISSDFDGFKPLRLSSDGNPKQISFGSNPSNKTHTVKVTVTKAGTGGTYADFDRLDVFYHGDNSDTNDSLTDEGISIVWANEFPAAGSLEPGEVYDMTAYIIDNNSLASAQALGSGSLFANSDDWSVQGDNVSTLSLEQTSSQHYTWNVRFTGNGKVTMQNANNTLMTDGSGSSVVYADWWKTDAEDKDYEKSPVHSYYETKYPELFSAGTQPAAGLQTSKVIKSDWLTSAINGESIEVKIADHAPVDSVRIHLIDHLLYLDTLSKNGDYESIVVSKGEIGTFLKKYGDSGVHVVVAEGVESEGTNEDLDYWIYRSDGRVEEYNAEDVIHRNAKVLHLGNTTQPEEDLSVSMTQYLPDRKLTFDSVEDGSELYLLKGGKYTCEEGLSLTPVTKGAVKVNNKNLKLTVKKDSLITLTKGDETKTVILHAVKLKKKTITLNSRKTSCSLSEIFTQAGEMLPDVENGKFLVSVLKDKNGILNDVNIPAADGTYVTLDDFTAGTTGKKGSALIQATFGGKVYKATVKCTGYPLLPESTVSGNLVQNLLESDAAGNRVVSFDSVENGDTLLLYKNGKYALESGVTIEPIGDEYSKAVKVKENEKTGIRTLTIKKEAPVRLKKGDDEKIILINRVAVKKKSVTLKPGMSCSLSDLIWNAYELLPDTQSKDPSDFAITVTDKKGAVFIQDGYFPAAGTSDSGSTTLDDFMIQHGGRKGSATVQVYFGGKAVKVKVNCK